MDHWTRIIGVALLLYASYTIYSGRISVQDQYSKRNEYLTRAEKPVLFWLVVALMLGLGVALTLNLFNFS